VIAMPQPRCSRPSEIEQKGYSGTFGRLLGGSIAPSLGKGHCQRPPLSHPAMPTPIALERFVGPPLYAPRGGGGITVHEASFEAGADIPLHVHDAAVISLIVRGVATEQISSGTQDIGAQDLILTPAYSLHGYHFRESGKWVNMQFSDDWFARLSDGNRLPHEKSRIIRSDTAAAWASRIHSEIHQRDNVSTLAIDGAMMLMMADLARARIDGASTRPRWLRRVEEAIEASIASPPSVEELAAIAGVHPTHLLRTFRRYQGATISNFIRQRRIQRARTEVAQAKRPLSMIALDAGFADQSHFTRVFKQTFGETPGQYARSLKGK
jgi:AraC family transcriptional regulator